MRAITKTCLRAWAKHLNESEKGRGKSFLEVMGSILTEEYDRGVRDASKLMGAQAGKNVCIVAAEQAVFAAEERKRKP